MAEPVGFAALNAGIDDRDDIFASIDPSKAPQKPDMSTFNVDFSAIYYGISVLRTTLYRTRFQREKSLSPPAWPASIPTPPSASMWRRSME